MINLKEVFFGFSDADKEASRNPNTFKEVFFDPHGYLHELIDGDRFLVIGRKGDGKTAYGAQIKLLSNDSACSFYAYQRSLNNFNNSTFEKIKANNDLGGNHYISFWKCVILIECVRMINKFEPTIQLEEFTDIVSALNDQGFFNFDNDIATTIIKLIESDTSLDIKSVFKHSRRHEYDKELKGADEIFSAILNSIKNLYLHKKFIFIIDGLDDILNNSEYKPEIITGLIRAVDFINEIMLKQTLNLKIIILIRDDIYNLCRDANLSKITRDSGIRLSWNIKDEPYKSDLIKLVSKRIDVVSGMENSFEDVWKDIFPSDVDGKDTLDYVLNNLIYRPRDILQFFIEAQKEFEEGEKFTSEKIKTILSRYSDEYFVDAMKDELTGFFPDNIVTKLPDVLSRIGSRYFYLEDFKEECKNYFDFENVSKIEILEKLFAAGYIGQHRPRDDRDLTVFSFRNSREKFDASHECILHRGLMRALTI